MIAVTVYINEDTITDAIRSLTISGSSGTAYIDDIVVGSVELTTYTSRTPPHIINSCQSHGHRFLPIPFESKDEIVAVCTFCGERK